MAKRFCFRSAMCLPHFCVSIVSLLRSAALFLLAHETVFMIQRALSLPLSHCRFCPGSVSSRGISFSTRKRSTGCWPLFYSPTAVKDSDAYATSRLPNQGRMIGILLEICRPFRRNFFKKLSLILARKKLCKASGMVFYSPQYLPLVSLQSSTDMLLWRYAVLFNNMRVKGWHRARVKFAKHLYDTLVRC